jgi:hypothetical protein
MDALVARSLTAYASANQRSRTHVTYVVRGEVFSLSFNVNASIGAATISTTTWQSTNTSSVTLGAESESGDVASVLCTAGYGPGAKVKCTLTASDGKVFVQVFEVFVDSGPSFAS